MDFGNFYHLTISYRKCWVLVIFTLITVSYLPSQKHSSFTRTPLLLFFLSFSVFIFISLRLNDSPFMSMSGSYLLKQGNLPMVTSLGELTALSTVAPIHSLYSFNVCLLHSFLEFLVIGILLVSSHLKFVISVITSAFAFS